MPAHRDLYCPPDNSVAHPPSDRAQHSSSDDATVHFVGIFWTIQEIEVGPGISTTKEFPIGFSFNFPELPTKGINAPQVGIFSAGIGSVVLDNVVPAWCWDSTMLPLLISLCGLVFGLCFFPPARAFGSSISFAEMRELSTILFSTSVLLFSSLTTIAFLLAKAFDLSNWPLMAEWLLLVVILGYGLAIRLFVLALSELCNFSKKRLFLAGIPSIALSAIVSPLVFFPALFLIFRFQELLTLLLQ
jgi:hypothetical protein